MDKPPSPLHDLNDKQATPAMGALLLKTIQTLLIVGPNLLLLPLYWFGRKKYHRPPNLPHLAQLKRYLRLTWTVQPPAPGLSRRARLWLSLSMVNKWLMVPLGGLAWLLDEALYGKQLNATPVVAPLFVISAGRSGSTQITRYLEADPDLAAPNVLQCTLPYLWLWKGVGATFGRIFSAEKVSARLISIFPPEFLERHEADAFKADTFDVVMLSAHLNQFSMFLGPDVSARDYNFGAFAPEDQTRMERDYVRLIDRIGRKQLLLDDATPSTAPRRLFFKGHFLSAADALAQHYPNATFLTLIREPAPRLQSAINFLRVAPSPPAIGPWPWAWLSASLLKTESDYCRLEQAWYTQEDGVRRCVIRFSDFVADIEGTMQHVYQTCLDQDQLPPHVPRSHPPRERKQYAINHSLAALGIDIDALNADLADYIAWCQPQSDASAKPPTPSAAQSPA